MQTQKGSKMPFPGFEKLRSRKLLQRAKFDEKMALTEKQSCDEPKFSLKLSYFVIVKRFGQ